MVYDNVMTYTVSKLFNKLKSPAALKTSCTCLLATLMVGASYAFAADLSNVSNHTWQAKMIVWYPTILTIVTMCSFMTDSSIL